MWKECKKEKWLECYVRAEYLEELVKAWCSDELVWDMEFE